MTHAFNIGTLALWLSVAGMEGVARLNPPDAPRSKAPEQVLTAEWVEPEILLGGEVSGSGEEAPAALEPGPAPEVPAELPETLAEVLPLPPELPEMPELSPLPEVPDPPAPEVARRVPDAGSRLAAERPASRPAGTGRADSRAVSGGRAGGAGQAAAGGAGGMSRGARLAGGRMPPPAYPAEARRRNQEGTVVVSFTVDANGSVIGARVATPSPWPLLNDAAVRAVRRWKFPAGPVMNLQQPVVFQLQ